MTATTYASVTRDVSALIARHGNAVEPDVAAYMIMRAAMLSINTRRSAEDVASLAYRLGDEFATSRNP
jgi:hypothetical protein